MVDILESSGGMNSIITTGGLGLVISFVLVIIGGWQALKQGNGPRGARFVLTGLFCGLISLRLVLVGLNWMLPLVADLLGVVVMLVILVGIMMTISIEQRRIRGQ